MQERDVAIVGGGILGTSVAHWLAARYDGRIVVIEREVQVAMHASRRNTGVVHRPFYLHPTKAKVFAHAAQISHALWKKYARERDLPWREAGTHKVAADEAQVKVLEPNVAGARENGMAPCEVQLLDGREVRQREPNLTCAGALLAKTDACVDFSAFTGAIRADAEALGVKFLTSAGVRGIDPK